MTEEYTILFHTITKAIEELEYLKQTLIAAQQQAEHIYMERGE